MMEEKKGQGAEASTNTASAPFPGGFSSLPEDPKVAQRVFSSLPVHTQLEIVLQARGKKRLDYLFLSTHPEQLVPLLPELEVFLTVKEVGEKDCLDLISLTTPDQFQYLLDLDFWKKDELDPERVLHWVRILLECGEKRVAQFIRTTDPGFIGLLLKKHLYVTTTERELLEEGAKVPLFTLDSHYFIQFKGRETRPVLQPFLQIFYRVDSDLYRSVMEALIWELESQLEENGYRLRNGRLADFGFPEFEEALEIYRFVHPNSLSLKKEPMLKGVLEETEKGRPTFYLTFQKEGPFLSSILSMIDDPLEQNRLKEEIASLCNKAMVAEAIDLFKVDEMERVTQKAFHYLDLGLQHLCQEDEARALEVLLSLPIQRVFQCGMGLTLLLKQKAEAVLKGAWLEGDRDNLSFLDSPFLEKFEGLLMKRPRLWRNGAYDDFKTLKDVKEMESFLESIETILMMLGEQWNLYPRTLKELDLRGSYPAGWRGITLSTGFLTTLANQVLHGAFQFKAIERDELKGLFSRIFEKDRKGVAKMEIRDGLKQWFESFEDDENRRNHLLAFRDFCLDLFEEEFGRIPEGQPIDPRFTKGLLLQK